MRLPGLPIFLPGGVACPPAPLTIAGTPVTTGTVGTPYAGFTVAAVGGFPPYLYTLVHGPSSGWLAVGVQTGAVSGTPTQAGTDAGIVIRATDSHGQTADLAPFQIAVEAPEGDWILAAGAWDDAGVWDDSASWNDG